MKQFAGDEIRRIMAEMPHELVEALQARHREHMITEYEARWWGFMMFARTGSYEGDEYSVAANGTGDVFTETLVAYVLQDRAGRERHGLKRPTWPPAVA
ncbi:MAG: hypothetical protein DI570_09970 [Phenylobacterium zucineum]|nr:MAG: hypothetical protein DI570_09970 [Phenylobacterium zucineum]